MSAEKFNPVLPALTDRVSDARYGARYKGLMPSAAGTQLHVLSNTQIEGLPGPVAVHLFRPDREVATLAENSDVHAIITYANGAVQNTFACDWDAQFSLVCSKISISLETYAPQSYGGYVPGTRQHVFGALIGVGACPSGGSNSVGYTTASMPLEFGVDGSTVAIPDFARWYYPFIGGWVADWVLGCLTVEMLNPLGFTMAQHVLTREILLNGLAIPGGAARVCVRPNTVAFGVGNLVVHHFKLGL